MSQPRSKTAKARTLPARATRPRTPRSQLVLSTRSGEKGDEIVVWLKGKGARPRQIGAINRRLAADAQRHGQDLVGALVDEALLVADRQTPSRSPRQ
ncbi:MAG: hypothetical protein Q8M19_00065 [Reyranella sp.]|nr:hypothetical protein [Reyranella sp.]